MNRPKIEDFHPNIDLKEAHKMFWGNPLWQYVNSLDKYIDFLEEEAIRRENLLLETLPHLPKP